MDIPQPPPPPPFPDLCAPSNHNVVVHGQSDPIQKTFLKEVVFTNHTGSSKGHHYLPEMHHNIYFRNGALPPISHKPPPPPPLLCMYNRYFLVIINRVMDTSKRSALQAVFRFAFSILLLQICSVCLMFYVGGQVFVKHF